VALHLLDPDFSSGKVYAKNQKHFFLLLLFRCWVVGAVEKKGANKMGLDGWLLRIRLGLAFVLMTPNRPYTQ
jgi:hypothetical protein